MRFLDIGKVFCNCSLIFLTHHLILKKLTNENVKRIHAPIQV